jgi:hypothetical protein
MATKPRYGRARTGPSFGKVGAFLTGGFAGPPMPAPKVKTPKPTQKQKDWETFKAIRQQARQSGDWESKWKAKFKGLQKPKR